VHKRSWVAYEFSVLSRNWKVAFRREREYCSPIKRKGAICYFVRRTNSSACPPGGRGKEGDKEASHCSQGGKKRTEFLLQGDSLGKYRQRRQVCGGRKGREHVAVAFRIRKGSQKEVCRLAVTRGSPSQGSLSSLKGTKAFYES